MTKKLVIVAGASRGIGLALANRLSETYNVVGFSRSDPEREINFKHISGVDITDKNELAKLARSMNLDDLWGVICCAGIASLNLFITMPEQTRKKIMDVNFHGSVNVIEVFGKKLIKKREGRIIGLTTIAIPMLLEGESTYAASKAALETYFKIVAKEVGKYGITSNLISPGPVKTKLIAGLTEEQLAGLVERLTIKQLCGFDDIFNVCEFYLSEKSGRITGQTISLGLATG